MIAMLQSVWPGRENSSVHYNHCIRSQDGAAPKDLAPQHALRIAALKPRQRRIEITDQIRQPVSIHILRAAAKGQALLAARSPECQRSLIDLRDSVEGGAGEDCNRNLAFALRIDRGWAIARLDVDADGHGLNQFKRPNIASGPRRPGDSPLIGGKLSGRRAVVSRTCRNGIHGGACR